MRHKPQGRVGCGESRGEERRAKGSLGERKGLPLDQSSLCVSVPVSEPFFPRESPWKAALTGTFPVLVLLFMGTSYMGWREHEAKERAVKKREKETHERDQMKAEKEIAVAAKGELGQQGTSEVREKTGVPCVEQMGTPRKTQGTNTSTQLGVLWREETHVGSQEICGSVMKPPQCHSNHPMSFCATVPQPVLLFLLVEMSPTIFCSCLSSRISFRNT